MIITVMSCLNISRLPDKPRLVAATSRVDWRMAGTQPAMQGGNTAKLGGAWCSVVRDTFS